MMLYQFEGDFDRGGARKAESLRHRNRCARKKRGGNAMKKFLAFTMMLSAMAFGMAVCPSTSAAAADVREVVDYSQKANWYQIPKITKEIPLTQRWTILKW